MRVLSRLFRRLFLEGCWRCTPAGGWRSSARAQRLADRRGLRCVISRRCARRTGWSTPSRPLPGREAVLAYLARYTHRVAISNSRLIAIDERGVTFRYKDYRATGQRATQP